MDYFLAFSNSSHNKALNPFDSWAFLLLCIDLMTSQMLLGIFPFGI